MYCYILGTQYKDHLFILWPLTGTDICIQSNEETLLREMWWGQKGIWLVEAAKSWDKNWQPNKLTIPMLNRPQKSTQWKGMRLSQWEQCLQSGNLSMSWSWTCVQSRMRCLQDMSSVRQQTSACDSGSFGCGRPEMAVAYRTNSGGYKVENPEVETS